MDRKENPFDQFDSASTNPFDQFDEAPVAQAANPFDQFDEPAKKPESQLAMREELVKGAVGAGKALVEQLPQAFRMEFGSRRANQAARELDQFARVDQGKIKKLVDETAPTSNLESYISASPEKRAELKQAATARAAEGMKDVSQAYKLYQQFQKENAKYQGRTPDITDVKNVTDFGNWLSYNVGAGAVNLAPVMMSALVAGAPGAFAVGTGLAYQETLGNRLEFLGKQLKGQSDEETAKNISDYLKKTGDTDAIVALASGTLDLAGPVWTILRRQAAKQAGKEAVKYATKKEAAIAGVKQVPREIAGEAVTGAAQEATQILGKRAVGEQTGDLLSKENLKDIVNAAAAEGVGGAMGSTINVATEVGQYEVQRRAQRRAQEELQKLEDVQRAEESTQQKPPVEPGRVEPFVGEEPPAPAPTEGIPGITRAEETIPEAALGLSEEEQNLVSGYLATGFGEEEALDRIMKRRDRLGGTRSEPPVETPMPPIQAEPKAPEPPTETSAEDLPTVFIPLKDLTLSKDVPQFKMGADEKGVVEPLGGKFERGGVAPIQVWRRLDGSLEVISGRHRLDLARRSGEKTIPSQIYDEAQGFTPQMAAVLDAELNIRDGQGKVKDYVNYFKASGIDPQDAESRGLLARATGKRAFTVATQGSDELVAAIRNDQVPDEAAYYIALNAPNDSRLQGVGLQAVMDGKSANMAVNMMQAVKALGIENNTTTDMFGFDDSALKEAQAMAQVAARKQREIQTRLSAISGAAKNPAIAKAEGIDIRDPNAVNQRIQELRQAKAAWDNWSTNPDLIGEIRQARGVQAPELTLRGETEEEIRAREEAAAAEEQRLRAEEDTAKRAEQQAAERARAEETVGLFELGQTPDQQLSGMGDLFASQEPAVAKEEPAEDSGLQKAFDQVGEELGRLANSIGAKQNLLPEEEASLSRFISALGNLMYELAKSGAKTFAQALPLAKKRATEELGDLAKYVPDEAYKTAYDRVSSIEDPAKKLAEKYPHPDVPILDKTPIKSALLQTWSNSKDLFKLFLDDPVEAASELGDVMFDAITQLRMEAFWFGAGLESRDFNRYGGQLRTSQGLAVASVALDNALYSNQIGIEVIFQGGLGLNHTSGRFTAVESPLGMRGVYEAEQRLAKQLGDQLAANTINRYLEAKRSISIKNELYDRENNYQEAKADFERLVNEGASEDIIDKARDAVAEAQAELKSINKAVTSVLMSEQEMEDSAALNKVYPELREIQQNWNAINQNLLRVWFDVGLLSKKRYEALSSIEDYVPWNRIMNDGEDPHASVEATTKNLVTIGRERLLKSGAPMETIDRKGKDGKKILDEQGNIVAHIFQVRPSTLLRVTVDGKRVPKKYLAITADQKIQINLPIDDGSLVQFQTTLPINNIIGNMTDNVMRMTVNAIRHYAAARIVNEYATRSPNGKLLTFPKADKKKGRVPYIQNGRKVFVEIPDPLVAGAMYGLDGLDVKMFSAMAAMANIVRRTITLDPSFQLKQILQDATSAAVVTGVKRPDKLIGGVLASFSKSLVAPAGKAVGFKTDPSINVLKAIGIGGFHSPSRTPEAEIKRRLGIMNRNVYHAAIKVLDHIGDASAMGQPLATYNRVMAETGDEMQAQYQASTVFPVLRRGKNKLAIAVSRTVAFANAYAAQIDILINQLLGGNLQGRSRVETWLRLGVAATGLATTTLIYCMLVGGDPDYEELDDQTKMKNFIIPGTDIKIPMNNSAAYFWKAVPEMLYNRIRKEGTKSEMDATRVSDALFTAAMDSLLGPQPIPTGPRAALEVIFDHSFLTGRELIPQNLKRLEAYAQWDASTSELGKMISNGTELPNGKRVLSPIEADHFVRGLFGTVGIVSQWAVNSIYESMGERPATAAQKVPLLGGFTLPKVGRLNEDLFYDLKERADQKYETWNRHIARGETKEAAEYMKEHSGLIAMHDYTSQVSSDLSELNQLIRYYGEYKKSVLSPELRRQKIESLQKTKQKILSSVQSQRRAAGL